jgi:hypothetical protein
MHLMLFGNLRMVAVATVLLIAAGLTPALAQCNCTMLPTAPSCCGDAPAQSCASPELSSDNCAAVVHDETIPAIRDAASSGMDSEFGRLAADTQSGERAALPGAGESKPPNKSPQLSDIPIFELDCCYLI